MDIQETDNKLNKDIDMKKVIERIVESPGAPNENDLWLNGKTLKKFQNGQWVAISGGGSDSGGEGDGGDSDSDIQIVELTYDHLPATGTLSASDLEKLDGDNCLLVMNGKYFRKTFSSDGGIDYKEIGLTTVLGGVRSIYFTASKPDGEYTIAYTYPIEANTQTPATTALENIKVGNTTYSVPLSPMIVDGIEYVISNPPHDDEEHFIPLDNQITAEAAIEHMIAGGRLLAHVTVWRDNHGEEDTDNFYMFPLDFFPEDQERETAASIRFYSPNYLAGMMWDDVFVIPEE